MEGGWAWETPWGEFREALPFLCSLGDSRGRSWKVSQDSEGPAPSPPVPEAWDGGRNPSPAPLGIWKAPGDPPQPGSDFEGGFNFELCCADIRPGLLCLMYPRAGL